MAKYLTAIPDSESGWILYSGNRVVSEGRDLAEAVGKRSNALIGVPAAQAPSFSILVPTLDSNLLSEMAYSQIEKRGLANGSMEETLFDYDVIDQSNGQTRLAIHVFDTPLPDGYIISSASGYTPSPLVRQRVQNGAMLWKENRQLVFTLFRDGRLLHSQVLSGASELNATTAQEINLLLLSLQGDTALEDDLPTTLTVAIYEDERDTNSESIFASTVNLETQFTEPKGAFRKAHPRPKLTPKSITRYRGQIRFLIWSAVFGLVLLAAYAAIGFYMWSSSKDDQKQVAQLEKEIAAIEPDVYAIQEMQERWQKIEPAFDQRWFPMNQLLQVTKALPSSGVVIREFKTRNQLIYINGDARDIQLALRLQSDLSSLPEFKHYDWTMPKPTMKSDNTASFKIEGKPKENEG